MVWPRRRYSLDAGARRDYSGSVPNPNALVSERNFGWLVIGLKVILFVAFLAVAALGFHYQQRLDEQRRNVDGAAGVTRELADVAIYAERVESARRGYLLENNPQFRDNMRIAANALTGARNNARRLTAQVSAQQEPMRRLDALIGEIDALQQRTAMLIETGRRDVAMEEFRAGHSVSVNREVRRLASEMIAAGADIYAERSGGLDRSGDILRYVLLLASLIGLTIALSSIWVVLRYTRYLRESRDALRLSNETLEARVETRTAELSQANDRLEALLREANHRVANSLQIVTAMVRMQANTLSDDAARDALEDTQRRIDSIARVHRSLYTSDSVDHVAMQDYLAPLLDELEETWSTPDARRDLSLSADDLMLETDQAVSVGVIVSELASNACKYAYAAKEDGAVRVRLARDGDTHFVLSVEDDGRGIDLKQAPEGTGLGTKLIAAMVKSLDATLDYSSEGKGVRAIVRAPL